MIDIPKLFTGFIQNTALLVSVVFLYTLISNRFVRPHLNRTRPAIRAVVTGTVFGTIGIIGMLSPIHVAPGIVVDGRVVVVGLGGVFGGVGSAVTAGTLVSAYRLWLGGVGALPGIGVILTAAALGAWVHWRWGTRVREFGPGHFLLLGAALAVAGLLWTLTVPDSNLAWRLLRLYALPVSVFYPLITLLLGLLFSYLHEERARLTFTQSSLDHASDAVFWINSEGQFVKSNPAACRLSGYSRDELRSMYLWDIDAKSTKDTWPAVWKTVQEEGAVVYESNFRTTDGRLVPVEISSSFMEFEGEEHVFAYARNITERKQAEEAVAQLERSYSRVLNIAPAWLWASNVEGTEIYLASPGAKFLTGYEPGEFIKHPSLWFELILEEDHGIVIEANQRARREKTTTGFECRIRHKDGRIRWMYDVIFPECDASGELVGVYGFMIDITERKQAERARRESEARFRTIFEMADAGIALANPEGKFLHVNSFFCRLLGYSEDEMKKLTVFDITHPDDLKETQLAVAETMRMPHHSVELEKRYVRRDGSIVWAHTTAAWIFDVNNKPAYRVAVILDITERKRAEDALRKQEEQLRQASKLAAVGQLAAGVAHEINNPLAVIVSQATRLEKTSRDSQARERAGKIRAQAQRAARIIEQLGSFAAPQAPRVEVVHLPEVVERVLSLREPAFQASGIRLEREITSGVPPVSGNGGDLEQVVLNLLLNAEHALATGGGRGTITIRLAAEGDRVLLAVADTGQGIPPDTLPRIFEPFFTTRPVGQGTGLGLPICYGIIQAHGGRIWVESPAGQGATVFVELPAVRTEPAVETPLSAHPALRHGHVLVVEDEEDVAEVLREILESLGQEVTVAPGGEAGWELLRRPEARYDMVTVDVKMPDLSGPDLWQRLVAQGSPLVSRVVFITGDIAEPETQTFLQSTGRPVLTKPFDEARLADLLVSWLSAP